MRTTRNLKNVKRHTRLYESSNRLKTVNHPLVEDLTAMLVGREYWNDETNDDNLPGVIDAVYLDSQKCTVYVTVIEADGYKHDEDLDIAIHSIADLTDEEIDDINDILDQCDCDSDDDYDEYEEDIEVRMPKSGRVMKARFKEDFYENCSESALSKRRNKSRKLNEQEECSADSSFLSEVLPGAECYGYDGKPGKNGENGKVLNVFLKGGCPWITVKCDDEIYHGKLSDCLKYIVLSSKDRADIEDYLAEFDCDVDECDASIKEMYRGTRKMSTRKNRIRNCR